MALDNASDLLVPTTLYDSVLRAVAEDPAIATAASSSQAYRQLDAALQRRVSAFPSDSSELRISAGQVVATNHIIPYQMAESWLVDFGGTVTDPLLRLAATVVHLQFVAGAVLPSGSASMLLPKAVFDHHDSELCAKQLLSALLSSLKALAQQVRPVSSSTSSSNSCAWAVDQVWALQFAVLSLLKGDDDLTRTRAATDAYSAGGAKTGSKKRPQQQRTAPTTAAGTPHQQQHMWLLLLGRILVVYSKAVEASLQEPPSSSSSSSSAASAFEAALYTRQVESLLEVLPLTLLRLQQQQQWDGLPGDDAAETGIEGCLSSCVKLLSQLNDLKQQQQNEEGRQEASLVLLPDWQGFAGGLKTLGQALCNLLPTELVCNNPGCGRFEGLSEMQGVSGKGRVCGGCKVARYCCKECATAHWKAGHRAVCKRIAGAT
jgi:hypothetical protein